MKEEDRAQFSQLLTSVQSFYRQDTSDFSLSVWWEACIAFDLPAVRNALNRHAINPDTGQFMPKPADIIRMLQGSTLDSALVAWSKVDKGVRYVGTHASVAFDDPIIHAVIQDMGGWVQFGSKTEGDWPFVAKEFQNRYRGYRMQGRTPEYPPTLIGIAEAQNGRIGFRSAPPVLIGNKEQAARVVQLGTNQPSIGLYRLKESDTLSLAAPRREAA